MKAKLLFAFAFILLLINFISTNAYADYYNAELRSDWSYYDKELIVHASEATNKPTLVNLPIEFKQLDLDTENYGTFVKTITIPNHLLNNKMGIELPFVYSAAKVYINGEELLEVGKVGKNVKDHEIDLQTVVAPFTPTSQHLEITIQLSSFNHIRGGFSGAPTIGDWDTIEHGFLFERYTVIFVGTIILIVGITTLAIGIMNRNEKIFLTFGLFAIVVALRGGVAVPFIYHELPFPISYVLATRLEYITTALCFSLYAIFIYLLYKKIYSKWYLYFNLIILLSIIVLSIFTEPKFFQSVFFSIFPLMLLYIAYNIWIMFKALFLKLELAKSLLLGILFVFIGLVLDFMSGIGIINIPPVASIMIMLNVLIVLFSLCINYVRHANKLTALNNALDKLVKERTVQLHDANEKLKKLVNTDPLTGISNRLHFGETIHKEFVQAEKTNTPLSLLMLDLDEYKKYNDYYGHVQGDELLIRVVQMIKDVLKDIEGATFVRYGGEEFTIILPKLSIEEAKEVAEKIRLTVETANLENLGRELGIVTVSIGCAERTSDQITNGMDLVKIADERLYMSKIRGRNQVTAKNVNLEK